MSILGKVFKASKVINKYDKREILYFFLCILCVLFLCVIEKLNGKAKSGDKAVIKVIYKEKQPKEVIVITLKN